MVARPRSRAVELIVATALALVALTARRVAAADEAPPFLGRWESVVRSTGALGQVLEFRPDGTMTQWVAVLVELNYQVVKGPLLLTIYRHPGSGSTETQIAGLEFDANTMIQRDPETQRRTLLTRKRAGGPQDEPIVGVWTTPHESGTTAYLLYTADGRLVYRLPIRADLGRWSVSGDQLTMSAGAGTTSFRYAVRGDRLLFDHQGKETVYSRAELLDY